MSWNRMAWNSWQSGWIGLGCCAVWFSAMVSALPAQEPTLTQEPSLTQRLAAEDQQALADEVLRIGDPVRGAIAFYRPELNCAKCHDAGTLGRRLGPALTERRDVSVLQLIESVLHPSAVIREGYETTLVQLIDGRQVMGIVTAADEQQLTIDRIEEPEQPLVIARDDIEDQKQVSLSSMPEGLANVLGDRSAFVDLIRYLEELARGGEVSAMQLRPAGVGASLAPLPAYESEIDHRGLITTLDQQRWEQGAEIYRLQCASCHGDRQHEGSMPTSLRFAKGTFKNGNDPWTMYRTLTHGYGMMIPQRSLVPEQKYAVIHYIRETFLKADNPSQYFEVTEAYLAGLPQGNSRGPQPNNTQPWTAMDYGPSLNNTIEVSTDGSNIAQKGIVIRVDEGLGGVAAGQHWIMYEHDTMRVAGAWSGEFIDYNGIHFNGVHGQHPRVAGDVHLQNPTGPGWARPSDGSWLDPRLQGRDGRHYGPLPRDWVRYRGMYRFGTQTILKYDVGSTELLESPALMYVEGRPAFVRNLNIGPRQTDMLLQIAKSEHTWRAEDAAWVSQQETTLEDVAKAKDLFDGGIFYQIDDGSDWNTTNQDFAIQARIKTDQDGTLVAITADQTDWVPNGQAWFIRGGRLTYDVGWVGAVQSNRRVDDGKWHDVGLSWQAEDQRVTFYVDGVAAGGGVLTTKGALPRPVIRIGKTNDNFPAASSFHGEMRELKIYQRSLQPTDFAEDSRSDGASPLAAWKAFEGDAVPGADQAFVAEPMVRTSSTQTPVAAISVIAKFSLGSQAQQLVSAATPSAGFKWVADDEGNLRLFIPAGPDDLKLSVSMLSLGPESPTAEVNEKLASLTSLARLEPLTHGGAPNWPDLLTTEMNVAQTDAAYAIDVLSHPEDNPGHCRLRLTGVDFLPDGDSAVVCTWDGSVWRVDGIGQTQPGAELKWRRIAAGLFQPLGIRLRAGIIYVTCRDQLVALHDLNQDGETDWYECFNSDHQVTEHFHEFAMGLQTDAEGNFYYAKSARHALRAVVPHHGTLLKVQADGSGTEIVANGFRAANGVCLNPDGTFVVTDQEGHWNPKNRINWVSQGGFYGNMFGYHDITDSSDEAMEPPLCWITNSFDRSPAELLWVDSERWGPLSGQLLNFSYGYGRMYVVPFERVGGQVQGGMCAFDLPPFPTGIMRGRFSPTDGQLYCCGMFAWSSTQEQPGGLYRVRYTGGKVHLPVGVQAQQGRMVVTFSEPIDAEAAADPANYGLTVWGLQRSEQYGSPHINEHPWEIKSVTVSADRRTVILEVPEMAPTWCYELVYAIKTEEQRDLQGRLHGTIHQLPTNSERQR